MTSMVERDGGQLLVVVSEVIARLKALIRSISELRGDARLREEVGIQFHYCVDYHDVRRYLDWRSPALGRRGRSEVLVRHYVRLLLFQRDVLQFVLLPYYYREFRAELGRLVLGQSEIENERLLVLGVMRRRLRELLGDERWMLQFESLEKTESAFEERLEVFAKLVREGLRGIERGSSRAQKAVLFIDRFELLRSSSRLLGAPPLATDDFREGRGKVFDRALQALQDSRKTRRGANSVDANAINMVYALNQTVRGGKERYLLVSSAPSMRKALDAVNEKLVADGEDLLELRDEYYWSLWFSVALRKGNEGLPTLGDIERIADQFLPMFGDLESKCESLRRVLMKSQSEKRPISQGLARAVELSLEQLESLFESMARPILDGRWLAAELQSGFGSVWLDPGVSSEVRKMEEILGSLRSNGLDFSEVFEQMNTVYARLEKALLEVEAVVSRSLERLEGRTAIQTSGWLVSGEAFDPDYRRIVETLEFEGAEGARGVIGLSEELFRRRGASFEHHIVVARLHLLEDRPAEAVQELGLVLDADRGRPSFHLTRADSFLVLGDLVSAESILRSLLSDISDGAVFLSLAAVLYGRFKLEGGRTLLTAASELVTKSAAYLDKRSLLYRAEVELLRLEVGLELGFASLEELRSAKRLLAGIVDKLAQLGARSDLLGRLYSMEGRLESLIEQLSTP